MATTVDTESPTHVGVNRLVKYGLLAVIVASVVNALARMAAFAAFDIPAEFALFPLGWGPVIASSAIGAIGATVVYGLLSRFVKRPNRTFTIIAAATLLLSLAGPLSMYLAPPGVPGFPSSVLVTLAVMHVIAAAAIVSVLTQALQSDVRSEAR